MVFCHPFRVNIPVLVSRLHSETALDPATIEEILRMQNHELGGLSSAEYGILGVTHRNDRVTPKEKEAGFTTASESISEPEVYRYVYQVQRFNKYDRSTDPRAVIARSLYKMFFGAHPLFEDSPTAERLNGTPNGVEPHEETPVKFYGPCIDPDTCTVAVFEPPECFRAGVLGFYGPARETQIDSAEMCPKIENKATGERKCVDGMISIEGKEWALKRLADPSYRLTKPPAHVKEKLTDNATRVFRELMFPEDQKYSPVYLETLFSTYNSDEIFKALQLIAAWTDYNSTVDTAVMNGFIKYAQDVRRSPLQTRETTVRFTSEDAPSHLCGTWQPYDRYLRRLTLYLARPEIIHDYLQQQFLRDLAAADQIYLDKKPFIEKASGELKQSAKPKMKELGTMLSGDKLKRPTEVFGPNLPAILANLDEFFRQAPVYQNCWTLVKVLLGLDKEYQKYRAQDFRAFAMAGGFAAQKGHGFFAVDPAFAALWRYNSRIERYHPKDCLTGQP